MSRSKVRKTDEIFQLKRKIKELQDENKKLLRKLNNETKKEKSIAKDLPKPIVEKDPASCEDCSKGKIQVIDLGARKMFVCSLGCGYRKVIKN